MILCMRFAIRSCGSILGGDYTEIEFVDRSGTGSKKSKGIYMYLVNMRDL